MKFSCFYPKGLQCLLLVRIFICEVLSNLVALAFSLILIVVIIRLFYQVEWFTYLVHLSTVAP